MADVEGVGVRYVERERRRPEPGREPLAVPLGRVPDWLGISRTGVYAEIAAGRLKAVKRGTRVLVPYAAGEAWLKNLPLKNKPKKRKP